MSKFIKIVILGLYGLVAGPVEDLWKEMDRLYEDRKEYVRQNFPTDPSMIRSIQWIEGVQNRAHFRQKVTDEDKQKFLFSRLGSIVFMHKDNMIEVKIIALKRLEHTDPGLQRFIDQMRQNAAEIEHQQDLMRRSLIVADRLGIRQQIMAQIRAKQEEAPITDEDRFHQQYKKAFSYVKVMSKEVEQMAFMITHVLSSFQVMIDEIKDLDALSEEEIRGINETHTDLLQAQTCVNSMYDDIATRGREFGYRNFGNSLKRLKELLRSLIKKYKPKISEAHTKYLEELIFVAEVAERFAPRYPKD